MKRIVLFALVFVVVACGGGRGSGGSGSNTPASSGEPPQPQDMQTGVFTDGPVSGLRYEQGELEGITNSLGEFQYDANSNEPVYFYVGEILLGGAEGQAVVTPYDLSSKGKPRSLQSGFNISRFLLSLDESSEPDIQLPEISQSLSGALDFSLDVGLFEQDELASKLIELYGSGEMLTVDQVQDHLSLNEHVATSIAEVEAQIQAQVDSLDIVWNSGLSGDGVLVKATANTGEVLMVEVALQGGSSDYFYLSQVSYFNAEGNYLAFSLNQNAVPEYVSVNGSVSRFVNAGYRDIQRLLRTETYTPTRLGLLIDEGGYSSRRETAYIDSARRSEIQELLNQIVDDELSDYDLLTMLSHVFVLLDGIGCGYDASGIGCESPMGSAVFLSLLNPTFLVNAISFDRQSISDVACVPYTNVNTVSTCGQSATLDEFNHMVSNQYDASGLSSLNPIYREVHFTALAIEYDYYDNDNYGEQYVCTINFAIQPLDNTHLFIQSNGFNESFQYDGEVYSCHWFDETCNPETCVPSPPPNWSEKISAIELMFDKIYSNYADVLTKVPSMGRYLSYESMLFVDHDSYIDWDVYEAAYITYITPFLGVDNVDEYLSTYISSGVANPNRPIDHVPLVDTFVDNDFDVYSWAAFGFISNGNWYDVTAYFYHPSE